MKTLYIIFFFSNYIFSQSYEFVEKMDTIIIVYRGKEYEKKKVTNKNDTLDIRHFYFNNIDFRFPRVENNFSEKTKIISKFETVKKSFIEKNKDKLIDVEFFFKLKNCFSTKSLFNQSKKIFILDYTSVKKGKIPLYPVTLFIHCVSKE